MEQIIHKGQHLLRHRSQDIGYTNDLYNTVYTVRQAIDKVIEDRFVSLVSKYTLGEQLLLNRGFENFSLQYMPEFWEYLGVEETYPGSITEETVKVHTGNSAAHMVTDTLSPIPGFGNVAGMKLGEQHPSSIVGHTYGISAWLMKDAGKKAQCVVVLQGEHSITGDSYIYFFTGIYAGTWRTEAGGRPALNPDNLFTVENGDINIGSYTKSLNISNITAPPANVGFGVILLSLDNNLGESSDLYIDTITAYDEASPSVDLMPNGNLENWELESDASSVTSWGYGDFEGTGDSDAEWIIQSTRVYSDNYALKLTNGIGVGQPNTIAFYQEVTIAAGNEYMINIPSGIELGSISPGRACLLDGIPTDREAGVGGWQKAFNFNTELWVDLSTTPGWYVSKTALRVGLINYDDNVFLATDSADAVQLIPVANTIVTISNKGLGEYNFDFATASVTGGIYNGNNITVIYNTNEFINAVALKAHLEARLGASSVSITNFYNAGNIPWSVDGNEYYPNTIPAGTSYAPGADPNDAVDLYYETGYNDSLPSGDDYYMDMSTVTTGYGETEYHLTNLPSGTKLGLVLTGSKESDDIVYYDYIGINVAVKNSPITLFNFESEQVLADLETGDLIFDYDVDGESLLSMDRLGKFNSDYYKKFDFTNKPVVANRVIRSDGYEHGEKLVGVVSVNMTIMGQTLLYTPEAGYSFIPTKVIVIPTEFTDGGGVAGSLSIGNDGAPYDNIVSPYAPSIYIDIADVQINSSMPICTTISPVYAEVFSSATYTAHTVSVLLYGYEILTP